MRTAIEVSEEDFKEHCNNNDGVCLICGDWTDGGVEPDAENYSCEVCENDQVFGAEQALIMGVVKFV